MAELSTSRINRQLRSLRAKCAGLNELQRRAHASSKPAVSVTYGSSRTAARRPQEEDDVPPLAILQCLDNFGMRLHLDRAIIENMQLSKRIYEVRDAFRNIVQAGAATPPSTEDSHERRVLPLTAICARLVGEHVQSEVRATAEEVAEEHGREDGLAAQVIDELYEQLPTPHRHRMFVAHALTYILEECTHHPTLLNALLEVCLSYALLPEAQTVLSYLFRVAVLPRPHSTHVCPITHPAHKNFLSTLRETCTTSAINDATFTHILVDILAEAIPTRLHAWTSKALTRLARELRERDFCGSFVPLCSGLASVLAEDRHNAKSKSKASKGLDDEFASLYAASLERLAKWTSSMLDTLHTSPGRQEDFRACVDFLVSVAPSSLHIGDDVAASPRTCLADALVCLVALCLSSPHAMSLHQSDQVVLQNILRSARIKNASFDGLVSKIFPLPHFVMFAMPLADPEGDDTPTPPPTPLDVHGNGLEELSALAAPLRVHGLLKCEAALWLAALQHIEELIAVPTVTQSMTTPGRKLNQSQLYNLRLELMDRVEDAERRCFGGGLGDGMAGLQPPGGEGEWEWEEMVGTWVLKSPAPAAAKKSSSGCHAHKRRKLETTVSAGPSRPSSQATVREAVATARPSQSSSSRYISASSASSRDSSASACRALSSRSEVIAKKKGTSSSGSSRAPSRAASSKENFEVEEVHPTQLVAHTTKAKSTAPPLRRTSNFATILADSRTNVISLRAEREAEAKARQAAASASRRPPARQRDLPISAPPALALPSRRQSNFATILADSQKNVISLREERARKAQETRRHKRRLSEDTMSDSEDELMLKPAGVREVYAPEPDSSPVRGGEMAHPSSDDALNLFAYPSSPIRRH
ncbi:hypothetical protein C8Q73DRAFT_730034 [Cubamyces lactineus]|nr:hypothetical protein C8Q73DRAFT_730034 [Cubamyces lactineus]